MEAFRGSIVERQRMERSLNREMNRIRFIQSNCDTIKDKIRGADLVSSEFLSVLSLTYDAAEPPTEAIEAMRNILEVRRATTTRNVNPERVNDTSAGIKSTVEMHTADETLRREAVDAAHEAIAASVAHAKSVQSTNTNRTDVAFTSFDDIMAMYSETPVTAAHTAAAPNNQTAAAQATEPAEDRGSTSDCIADMLAQTRIVQEASSGGAATVRDEFDLNLDEAGV
jgi:hypothetical protein